MRHGRLVDAVPIFRNFALSLVERQCSRADFGVQIVFHLVLGMSATVGHGCLEWFGPKISWVSGVASKFERDEMVFFIRPQAGVGVAIFADLFNFQALRV